MRCPNAPLPSLLPFLGTARGLLRSLITTLVPSRIPDEIQIEYFEKLQAFRVRAGSEVANLNLLERWTGHVKVIGHDGGDARNPLSERYSMPRGFAKLCRHPPFKAVGIAEQHHSHPKLIVFQCGDAPPAPFRLIRNVYFARLVAPVPPQPAGSSCWTTP